MKDKLNSAYERSYISDKALEYLPNDLKYRMKNGLYGRDFAEIHRRNNDEDEEVVKRKFRQLCEC